LPTIDSDNLWQHASARWAEITAISPDLTPAVALQQRLIRLTLDAAGRLPASLSSTMTDAAVLHKWRRGLPAWRNERVGVPDALKRTVPAFCEAIAEAGGGESALHIGCAPQRPDDAESLLRCRWREIKGHPHERPTHGPPPVCVAGWRVGSSPLAHHLQRQVLAGLTAG
jgi:hypothetical protein